MNFLKVWNAVYSIGEEQRYSVFEVPQDIIGSFIFAIFCYTLFLFGVVK